MRAERLANQIRDLEEELVRQRDRSTKLSKLLDDEKPKSAKQAQKLLAFAAAQLDGYCGRKCRKLARRS